MEGYRVWAADLAVSGKGVYRSDNSWMSMKRSEQLSKDVFAESRRSTKMPMVFQSNNTLSFHPENAHGRKLAFDLERSE